MEDVFELLRQRSGKLELDAVNTVLACLDALSEAVDSIEESGTESLDPQPLIDQLLKLVHSRTPEQEVERAGGAELPEETRDQTAALDAGRRVLYVKATLADDVMMPAVRAYMLFTALDDHGEHDRQHPREGRRRAVRRPRGGGVARRRTSRRRRSRVRGTPSRTSPAVLVREHSETVAGAFVDAALPVAGEPAADGATEPGSAVAAATEPPVTEPAHPASAGDDHPHRPRPHRPPRTAHRTGPSASTRSASTR